MKKHDKILDFLLKPPMWVCIVVWVIGTLTLGGSITLYFVGLGLKLWALHVHLTALVFLILSIYAVLTVIGIPKRAKNNVRVQKFFKHYDVRAFVYAAGSIIFNTCYVVFGILIANIGQSAWLGVLVGYHIFLIIPRATVFFIKRRDGDKDVQNVRAYSYCGLALMLLALAVIPVIRMVLDDRNTYNYFASGIIYVTAIAAYTFTKLGIAIYNLRKVRKSDNMPLKAIKNVSFADALISIFALQAMMIKVLPSDSGDLSHMNSVLGGLVAFGIFAIGLYMLVSGRKKLKALPVETAEQADVESADEQSEEVSEGE
ncbi:MAG: hypothetical protein K2M47_03925 [Clostridiales bacterium]|nr:hypothetical protein [Clostridiales bacterium]